MGRCQSAPGGLGGAPPGLGRALAGSGRSLAAGIGRPFGPGLRISASAFALSDLPADPLTRHEQLPLRGDLLQTVFDAGPLFQVAGVGPLTLISVRDLFLVSIVRIHTACLPRKTSG